MKFCWFREADKICAKCQLAICGDKPPSGKEESDYEKGQKKTFILNLQDSHFWPLVVSSEPGPGLQAHI